TSSSRSTRVRIGSRPLARALVLLLAWVLPTAAEGWSLRLRSVAPVLATSGRDEVVTVVPHPTPDHEEFAHIVKLSARSGWTVWRRPWRGRGSERSDMVSALVALPNGDTVAGGTMLNGAQRDDFVVRRLDARTGQRRWQAIVRGRAARASYE